MDIKWVCCIVLEELNVQEGMLKRVTDFHIFAESKTSLENKLSILLDDYCNAKRVTSMRAFEVAREFGVERIKVNTKIKHIVEVKEK